MTSLRHAVAVSGRGSQETTVRRPPRAPVVFLGVMLALGAACLATGVVDVLLPVLAGEEPFTVLQLLVEELGPAYLFFHIFVHNLGLACIVPGAGLLAARYEKSAKGRKLAALILLVAVVLALLIAIEYLIQARERFDLAIVAPLIMVEAFGVLALAWRGYRVVSTFRPTPKIGWSLVHPARELAPWFAGSAIVLALAALVEVGVIAGFVA